MLLCLQPELQQFGRQFIQSRPTLFRQRMKLRDQIGMQFDGKWDQPERLIALALFTPIDGARRTLAKTSWRGGMMYLALYFLAFGFFEFCFFQCRNQIG